MPDLVDDPGVLLDRARALAAAGTRRLLGLAGPPGAGKSTLAASLAAELGASAVVVPMDGFHLAQAELIRLGRAERKGAPDTFDPAGYVALLRRLRCATEVVYAPAFDRGLEEPIAGAIAVDPAVPLVVTEGNYLLLDGPWAPVRQLLDEVWWVDLPEDERLARLVARHAAHGKAAEAARAWASGSDARNAALVEPTRARADVVVALTARPPDPAAGVRAAIEARLRFRAMTRTDLPRVAGWRAQPHVAPWFPPLDAAALEAKYAPRIAGEDPTRMYVVELAGGPVGFAQCYRHADLPATDAAVGVARAVGIDYCLGEPALLGRGWGPRLIDAFVTEVVAPAFPEARVVVGAPRVDNLPSIRALERAGFARAHQAVQPGTGHRLQVLLRRLP